MKLYCREFDPASFESRNLKVDFFAADSGASGKYPAHVSSAVFDRLQIIRDGSDWDCCLVMDYDQLVVCDLAPLFQTDFARGRNEALLAARRHGEGIDLAYAMKHYRGGEPIPRGWEHAGTTPYFCMGPLMNLKAMREAGTWEKVLAAHEAFNAEEQIALTAATAGRTMPYDERWNRFPDRTWSPYRIPDGVIHWTGPAKPWHYESPVWRPDLWESEETSWEALRNGWWEKPLAVLVEPEGYRTINGLCRRGWKVLVLNSGEWPAKQPAWAPTDPHPQRLDDEIYRPFPDLEVVPIEKGVPPGSVALPEETRLTGRRGIFAGAEMVRFGAGSHVRGWLDRVGERPDYLVIEGPCPTKVWTGLRRKGYRSHAILVRHAWPVGGPKPSVVSYDTDTTPRAITDGEDLFLRRAEGGQACGIGVLANVR